jgi:hypothetical protein
VVSSPRAERDAILYATDREIDTLSRPIARAVVASVRRHAVETPEGPRLTAMSRVRIMAEVDSALSSVYGRAPNDAASPLYRLIVRRAREAALKPVTAAVADIRHRLRGEPELLTMIEREGVDAGD